MAPYPYKKPGTYFQNRRKKGNFKGKTEKNKGVSGELENIPVFREHPLMRDRLL